jgi:hypothetical protein
VYAEETISLLMQVARKMVTQTPDKEMELGWANANGR